MIPIDVLIQALLMIGCYVGVLLTIQTCLLWQLARSKS